MVVDGEKGAEEAGKGRNTAPLAVAVIMIAAVGFAAGAVVLWRRYKSIPRQGEEGYLSNAADSL